MGKFGADHNFIVVGPRRTGSILIAQALGKILSKPVIKFNFDWQNIIDVNKTSILHSHRPNLPLIFDRRQYVLIVSRRRDTFLGAISEVVSRHTGEFETYTKNEIDLINSPPFKHHVDVGDFDKVFCDRNDFYKQIDTSEYAHVVDVYLEDVLQYPYYLFERIGFTQKIATPIETVKSPYRGRDIISNYDELEAYWLKKTSF
jgi:hypothetical protein